MRRANDVTESQCRPELRHELFEWHVLDLDVCQSFYAEPLAGIQDFDADDMPFFVEIHGHPVFDVNVIPGLDFTENDVQGVCLAILLDLHRSHSCGALRFKTAVITALNCSSSTQVTRRNLSLSIVHE